MKPFTKKCLSWSIYMRSFETPPFYYVCDLLIVTYLILRVFSGISSWSPPSKGISISSSASIMRCASWVMKKSLVNNFDKMVEPSHQEKFNKELKLQAALRGPSLCGTATTFIMPVISVRKQPKIFLSFLFFHL